MANIHKMREQELLQKIEDNSVLLDQARVNLKTAKQSLNDLETEVIGYKIAEDNLLEELRLVRARAGDE